MERSLKMFAVFEDDSGVPEHFLLPNQILNKVKIRPNIQNVLHSLVWMHQNLSLFYLLHFPVVYMIVSAFLAQMILQRHWTRWAPWKVKRLVFLHLNIISGVFNFDLFWLKQENLPTNIWIIPSLFLYIELYDTFWISICNNRFIPILPNSPLISYLNKTVTTLMK